MSVIVSRAPPDVRDGLKPVPRRVLYAMDQLGLVPGRPYKKCANALLAAETTTGANGVRVFALPHDRLRAAMRKYNRLAR